MSFQIVFHEQDRILEVIYPERPTAADVADYLSKVRPIIENMGGPWSALVDQSQLRMLGREFVPQMASLNAFAQLKGMQRSARIVLDAPSGLQAWRMTKQALLTIPTSTFDNRKDALAWLKDPEA
jgi:hypothetical protein